ncbi:MULTISPECIES: YpiF family protein [Bacillus]|uniref:YpiF family protein n=1 Tax=Bacillus TaxID=1386 RepID=UPI000405662E|nr:MULTISPECIES: YpiF family protein [Bacillus]QHZ47413.1 YpiF family protein [Bacillus sp. NSP9.1]WFA03470.1 YpiF family protein [Bacillus sp. HSf4]
MKWNAHDADVYLNAKEYIDTAVIPLISVQLGDQFKSAVSKGEFTSILAEELERQLKGRVYLFPPYTYLHADEKSAEDLADLEEMAARHFRHIVFLTTDERWKQVLGNEQKLLWIPAIPLEHMKDSLKQKLLEDQIEQILNILLQNWNS